MGSPSFQEAKCIYKWFLQTWFRKALVLLSCDKTGEASLSFPCSSGYECLSRKRGTFKGWGNQNPGKIHHFHRFIHASLLYSLVIKRTVLQLLADCVFPELSPKRDVAPLINHAWDPQFRCHDSSTAHPSTLFPSGSSTSRGNCDRWRMEWSRFTLYPSGRIQGSSFSCLGALACVICY